MRALRLTAVLAACISLAGCLQASTIITVKPDGSGTLEQTSMMTAAALAQFRLFAGGLGGGARGAVEPFTEAQDRAEAQRIPGVSFVSSTPVRSADGEGRRTLYAFTDITQVKVNERPRAPGGVAVRDETIDTKQIEPISFTMTKTADGNALLTVHFPEPALPPPSERPDAAKNPPTTEQIATARRLFGGMKILIALEVAGRLIRTSSAYVDGNRVTLFEMDFDRLMEDPAVIPRLQAAKSVEAAKEILRDVPGMKINAGREITVEMGTAR